MLGAGPYNHLNQTAEFKRLLQGGFFLVKKGFFLNIMLEVAQHLKTCMKTAAALPSEILSSVDHQQKLQLATTTPME